MYVLPFGALCVLASLGNAVLGGRLLAGVFVGWLLAIIFNLDTPIWSLRLANRSRPPAPTKEIYDQIAEEFRTNSCDQGLLLKAMAETRGDRDKAVALYTAERAAMLSSASLQQDQKSANETDSWVITVAWVGLTLIAVIAIGGWYLIRSEVPWTTPTTNALAAPSVANPPSQQAPSAGDLYNTGLSYEKGSGVSQDDKAAMQWYQKAAAAGSTAAMVKIGRYYGIGGGGVAQDPDQEWAWYQKAAASGDTQAMAEIGVVYQNRAHDFAHALEWYEKAAAGGNADGMYCLGELYENGFGVDQDEKTAVEWFQKGAAIGDRDSKDVLPAAMFRLGCAYETGRGEDQDYAQALQWFQKAADLGNPNAMNEIGTLYANGWGVSQSDGMAMEWVIKAANAGSVTEMRDVAERYAEGIGGFPRDSAKAAEWYSKAANKGDSNAMVALGSLYASGAGVPQDYAESNKWFQTAAAKGDSEAMFQLGWAYQQGHGVPVSMTSAISWYKEAANQGHNGAVAMLKRLGN